MSVPTAVQLNRSFDPALLAKDLEIAVAHYRALPQVGHYHDGSWTGISLVSLDGDHKNVLGRPQGVGVPTKVLEKCEYFRDAVLGSLGFQVATSRLLFLHPGKKIGTHKDFDMWPQGIIRLHIPIVTNPGVHFMVDNKLMSWKPGEFWFADFRKDHSVHNTSDITRVHLVMDAMINDQLLSLFPPDALAAIREEVEIGAHQEHVKPDENVLQRLSGYFMIPRALIHPYLPILCKFERHEDFLDFTIPGFLFKQRFRPIGPNTFEGMFFQFELGRTKSDEIKSEQKAYLPFRLVRYTVCEADGSRPGDVRFLATAQDGSGREFTQQVSTSLPRHTRLQSLIQEGAGNGLTRMMLVGMRARQLTRKVFGVSAMKPNGTSHEETEASVGEEQTTAGGQSPDAQNLGVMDASYAEGRRKIAYYSWRMRVRAAFAARAFTQLRGERPGLRVLDLGAAEGLTMLEMRELLGHDGQYDGVELSKELVAVAPPMPPGTRLLMGDATHLPAEIEEGSYDLCAVMAVLEHLSNPKACLAEAYRALAPGGVLVLSCPHPIWDEISDKLRMGQHGEHHESHMNEADLKRLAHEAGFIDVRGERFMWAPVGILPYAHMGPSPSLTLDIDAQVRKFRAFDLTFVNQGVIAVKPFLADVKISASSGAAEMSRQSE